MTRTSKPLGEVKGIRANMIRNAMACNKVLSKEYLLSKSNEELLCFVHPFDRVDFAVRLGVKNVAKFIDPEFE